MYNSNLSRSRRPAVNIIGRGGNDNDDSDNVMRKKYCPREGRLLVFREDINNFFCPVCAYEYVSKEEQKRRKLQKEGIEEGESSSPPLGSISGLQSKPGQVGSSRDEQDGEALRFRPIPSTARRSTNFRQRGLQAGSEDPDADMFKKLGYVIQSVQEDIAADGTYNSAEEAERRKRYSRDRR